MMFAIAVGASATPAIEEPTMVGREAATIAKSAIALPKLIRRLFRR